jgi:hypothetical protein
MLADQLGTPVDIPGYPLAVAYRSADGRLLVVLEFRAGRMGTSPMDRLICPWCRSKDFLVESKYWRRFLPGAAPPKNRSMPSCGCRKGFKCVWNRYRNAGGSSHFGVDRDILKNG